MPVREADALTVENEELNRDVETIDGGFRCQPYEGLPAVTFSLGKTEHTFDADPAWYKNVVFSADARRGYPDREDQFSPGNPTTTSFDGYAGYYFEDPARRFSGRTHRLTSRTGRLSSRRVDIPQFCGYCRD